MAGDLARRIGKLELGRIGAGETAPLVDRGPPETREEWLARVAAGLEWVRSDDGTWVVRPSERLGAIGIDCGPPVTPRRLPAS